MNLGLLNIWKFGHVGNSSKFQDKGKLVTVLLLIRAAKPSLMHVAQAWRFWSSAEWWGRSRCSHGLLLIHILTLRALSQASACYRKTDALFPVGEMLQTEMRDDVTKWRALGWGQECFCVTPWDSHYQDISPACETINILSCANGPVRIAIKAH